MSTSTVPTPAVDEIVDGGEDPQVVAPATHKQINVWRLVGLAFVFTCGGPFGIEAPMRAAGPGLGILGILLTPIFFVLPQVVMVAELATMIPSNHGYVAWVSRAFGPFVGFLNAFNHMLANIVDMAVYAALFSSYLCVQFAPNLAFPSQYIIRIICVAICTVLALLESKRVAEFATVIGALVMLPFAIGFCAAIPNMSFTQWGGVKDTVDWPLYGSSLCWMFTGWSSLGNLAAEVSSPNVYARGMFFAIVLDVLAYLGPVTAALTIPSHLVKPDKYWEDGYLAVGFNSIIPGLGPVISVAAALSIFGMLVSCMTCYARAVAGMAECGWLPMFLAKTRQGSLVPHVAVITFSAIVAVVSAFDFDFLIQVDMVLAAESYIICFVAFIRLRYTEPDTPRPYRVPFGMVGAWGTTLVKIAIMVTIMTLIFVSSPAIFGVWIGVNIFVMGLYLVLNHPKFNQWRGGRRDVDGVIIVEEPSVPLEGDREMT